MQNNKKRLNKDFLSQYLSVLQKEVDEYYLNELINLKNTGLLRSFRLQKKIDVGREEIALFLHWKHHISFQFNEYYVKRLLNNTFKNVVVYGEEKDRCLFDNLQIFEMNQPITTPALIIFPNYLTEKEILEYLKINKCENIYTFWIIKDIHSPYIEPINKLVSFFAFSTGHLLLSGICIFGFAVPPIPFTKSSGGSLLSTIEMGTHNYPLLKVIIKYFEILKNIRYENLKSK